MNADPHPIIVATYNCRTCGAPLGKAYAGFDPDTEAKCDTCRSVEMHLGKYLESANGRKFVRKMLKLRENIIKLERHKERNERRRG